MTNSVTKKMTRKTTQPKLNEYNVDQTYNLKERRNMNLVQNVQCFPKDKILTFSKERITKKLLVKSLLLNFKINRKTNRIFVLGLGEVSACLKINFCLRFFFFVMRVWKS